MSSRDPSGVLAPTCSLNLKDMHDQLKLQNDTLRGKEEQRPADQEMKGKVRVKSLVLWLLSDCESDKPYHQRRDGSERTWLDDISQKDQGAFSEKTSLSGDSKPPKCDSVFRVNVCGFFHFYRFVCFS